MRENVLVIDSIRDFAAEVTCRDFFTGLNHLYSGRQWEVVYLDFDLNTKDEEGTEYTGRTLLSHLVENPPPVLPKGFKITTSNLVARDHMLRLLSELGYGNTPYSTLYSREGI